MPIAQTRLETLQLCKLLQCVREKDTDQIEKMTLNGVPHLINYIDATEGQTALSVAACANDDVMIEFLLSLGAHPDVLDSKGRSSAMRAAEYGHVDCLQKLAEKGANMKLADLEGKGILFYCISPTQRHAKCLEIAVVHGAEPNNVSKEGIPVLLFACETAMDNEDMCLQLIQKGADPNSKQQIDDAVAKLPPRKLKMNQKTGKTALMAASASGSLKVVRAILQNGGDVNATDLRHNHSAHFAAGGGHLQVLACMSGYGALFDQVDADGNTPIHNAAAGGHAMCIKFLVQRGCNPKPKNNEGNQAKTIAKDMGHKEAFKEARKAEKSFGKVGKNNEPWALAMYDFIFERQEQVKNMFTKYYDHDEEGTVGKNEFFDSMLAMNPPVSEEELKKIQQAHDKGKDGQVDYNEFMLGKKYVNKNFLMSAFEGKKKKKKGGKKGGKKKGKFKLVMPICTMEDGPRTYGGGPPDMFISRHIHFTDTGRFDRDKPPSHPLQDDSAWYLQHPEKTYLNINDAARSGDFDSLKNAFQRGTPVDTRDKYYKTPLMVSCSVGNHKMVQYLLENGANVNARDNFRWTPLHHACHAGQLDIVQTLMDMGAEMDATAMSGGTPLQRAIESSRQGVVDFLIKKGARIQTENKKGHNPVDVAQSWADPRVLDCVQSKWDSLPPVGQGKGKGGKKGGGSTKRPQSVPAGENAPPGTAPDPQSARPIFDDGAPRQRKGSILRAASALAGGIDEQEDVTYTPLKAWTKQDTTDELIGQRRTKRDRYGWEVDFPDFEMPFNKNVSRKIEEMGGADED